MSDSGLPPHHAAIQSPAITTPDSQPTVSFLGERYHLRLTGDDTHGEFALVETRGRLGHASPLHVHQTATETFVLLDGEMHLVVGDEEHRLVAGSTAVLPANVPHGFVIISDSARYLTLHHGPGFENFLLDASQSAEDGSAELPEVAARHGIEIVGPPPTAPPPG